MAQTEVPRTLEEALRMGFEVNGSDANEESEDFQRESGSYELSHQDGTCLTVPYRAEFTFGKPKMDRKATRWAKDRREHPEKYTLDGVLRRKGEDSPVIILKRDVVRVCLEGKVMDINRKDGAITEYGRKAA